ncbi:MAG: LacI family DNA-binding transcriptional regulator [Opitutales bacterium]
MTIGVLSPPTSNPTQKDVARLAQVSQTSVSAVMRGDFAHTRVNQETRERILEAARQLNYRLNISARAIRERRSFNLGYFTASNDPMEWDHPALRTGVFEEASLHQYNILLLRLRQNADSLSESLPRIFTQSHLDGLIVNVFSQLDEDIAAAMRDTGLPIVFANMRRRHNAVYVDEFHAVRQFIDHVIEQGYQSAAYLANDVDHEHYSATDRREAFRRDCEHAGLRTSALNVKRKGADEPIRRWTESLPPKTAVLCYDSTLALIFQRICLQIGRALPGDLAFAFFNETNPTQFVADPTLIQPPFMQLGRESVRMLMELIEQGHGARLPARAVQSRLLKHDTIPAAG